MDIWLQRIYHVATIIVACVAVAGYILSSKSTQETSQTSERIVESLRFLTEPLIKITGDHWIGDAESKQQTFSCENTPIGIKVFFTNVSNVAAQLHRTQTRYFFGNREFPITPKSSPPIITILAPGESRNAVTHDKELWQKALKEPKSVYDQPYVRVIHELEYSRVNDTQHYLYQAERSIGFDCSMPQGQYSHTEEKNMPIPKDGH